MPAINITKAQIDKAVAIIGNALMESLVNPSESRVALLCFSENTSETF